MMTDEQVCDGPPLDEGDTLALRFPGPPKVMPHDGPADEYAIVRCPAAAFGLVVYAKFHGKWEMNTGAERAVAKVLLERLEKAEAQLERLDLDKDMAGDCLQMVAERKG